MKFAIAIDVFNNIVDGRDGTLRLDGGNFPQGGYFVGGNGKPLIFDSVEEANTSDAMRRINEFTQTLSSEYVGWWTDSVDGRVYVDGTDWIESEFTATQLGRLRKEIAVWDIGRERELRLAYVDGE